MHTLYKEGVAVGSVDIPDDVLVGAHRVAAFLNQHPGAQLCGLGYVSELHRKIITLAHERDALHRQLEFADHLINSIRQEKGVAP